MYIETRNKYFNITNTYPVCIDEYLTQVLSVDVKPIGTFMFWYASNTKLMLSLFFYIIINIYLISIGLKPHLNSAFTVLY